MSTASVTGDLEIEQYFKLIQNLILKCGTIMNEGFVSKQTKFKTKTAFYDIVTEYDKKIEDIIINGISEEYPSHKFIGEEEQAESKVEALLTDDPTWIIDPIDGTTNFMKKIPQACISVGLSINKQLVLGIVYNPMLNELFAAKTGHGAFFNGEQIHASRVSDVKDAVLGYEISLIHDKRVRDKNVKRIYKLASNCTGTRCVGSAALSLCYVAMGRFDAYHVDDLKPWDIAGGAVVLREAGGVLTHTSGGEFNIMKPDLIGSSTLELNQQIVGLIKEADSITSYNFE